MTTLGSNVEKFIKDPDQYVLYTSKDKKGTTIVDASKKGVRTWLAARLAFWRSYKLPSVMRDLQACPTTPTNLLEKLQPKITHYNKKHPKTKIVFETIFPSAKVSEQPKPITPPPPKQVPMQKTTGSKPQEGPYANNARKNLTSNRTTENSVIDISKLELPIGMNRAKGAFLYSYCTQDAVETTPPEEKQKHVNDFSWGCAWRAIQTCLSSLVGREEVPRFIDLYEKYGDAEKLIELYADKEKLEKETVANLFAKAPHNISNGWAEPFVGEMVLHQLGYAAELVTVNGIPGNANFKEILKTKKTLGFADFRTKLDTHFSKGHPSPVMIDNGTFAMNIIGCRLNPEEKTTLWISDTHLNGGCTKPDAEKPGIFCVTLNANGSIESFEPHDPVDQKALPEAIRKQMLSFGSPSQSLDFSRNWMILFPGEKIST